VLGRFRWQSPPVAAAESASAAHRPSHLVSRAPLQLDLKPAEVINMLPARLRRRFSRGLTRKHTTLLKKLRTAKRNVKPMEKPATVRTHLRNMPVLPEMVGAMVAVYSGKVFNVVEIRPEMIGKYLAEFSISYKPTLHGRPGLGATHSSRFIPLK